MNKKSRSIFTTIMLIITIYTLMVTAGLWAITNRILGILDDSVSTISYETNEIQEVIDSTKNEAQGANNSTTNERQGVNSSVKTDIDNSIYVTNPFDDSELLNSATDVYYGVYFFDNGMYYSSNNSNKTPSASVIKVFIMYYLFSQIDSGILSADDIINGESIDKLIKDMIQKSDNTAANILIDKYGMNEINTFVQAEGYNDTVLERKMLDYDAMANGLDNYTSVNDTIKFLKLLYSKQLEYPYNEMLEIMKGQTIKTKIPALLPSQAVVANKTGEIDGVENDIGIVFGERKDFAIAVLTNQSKGSGITQEAISKFAKEVYDYANSH